MIESRGTHAVNQALAAAEAADGTLMDRLQMLVEMALELQQAPKTPADLGHALTLYDRALALCSPSEVLLSARIRVHKASALRAVPGPGTEALQQARVELEAALEALINAGGNADEIGVAEMSLGVVLQALAGERAAKITDAISAYQRAARVFDRQRHPRHFAILQNNLATAYLSMPVVDARAKLREALAVQAFTEALQVVSLLDDPVEYAMLQNNLGNALQYAHSGHPVENNLRALEAYDEALKVRTARDTPVEYANTVANKANCLRNLAASPSLHAHGVEATGAACANAATGESRLFEAAKLYAEAQRIYQRHGELERAGIVAEARAEILGELGDDVGSAALAHEFGESRV